MSWFTIVKLKRRGKYRRGFRKDPNRPNKPEKIKPDDWSEEDEAQGKDFQQNELQSTSKKPRVIADLVIVHPKTTVMGPNNLSFTAQKRPKQDNWKHHDTGAFNNQMQRHGPCNTALGKIENTLHSLTDTDFNNKMLRVSAHELYTEAEDFFEENPDYVLESGDLLTNEIPYKIELEVPDTDEKIHERIACILVDAYKKLAGLIDANKTGRNSLEIPIYDDGETLSEGTALENPTEEEIRSNHEWEAPDDDTYINDRWDRKTQQYVTRVNSTSDAFAHGKFKPGWKQIVSSKKTLIATLDIECKIEKNKINEVNTMRAGFSLNDEKDGGISLDSGEIIYRCDLQFGKNGGPTNVVLTDSAINTIANYLR